MFHSLAYCAFYYCNLCHVCKQAPEYLKRCSNCKTVAYCSKEHQKQDWKIHKELCQVIVTTKKATSKIKVKSFEDYLNYQKLTCTLWQNHLNRTLFNFEMQMWMFPRVCVVCFSSDVLIDCRKCLGVSYCSLEHKNVYAERHREYCEVLKLALDLDLFNFQNEHIPTELYVPDFLEDIKVLPEDIEKLAKLCYGNGSLKNICSNKIQNIINVEKIAPVATILYSLEKTGLLNNRMLKKQSLTIHIVGADITEICWLGRIMSELPFHWIKNLNSLEYILIGPELGHNGTTEEFNKELCQKCKAKSSSIRWIFHSDLYHKVENQLKKPDIIIAFNSGLHVCSEDPELNTWKESITYFTKNGGIPLILTGYTLEEVQKDVDAVMKNSDKQVNIIVEPKQNPFSSVKPIRDYNDQNAPIFYINAYITILTAE